jgi:ribosomal protein S25
VGGAKKKSLAQIEKAQAMQKKKEEMKKTKAKAAVEKKSRGIDMPNIREPRFLTELSKLGAVTPYSLASQFNLRISVAKDLLEELEREKLVRAVGGGSRIKIYQVAAT